MSAPHDCQKCPALAACRYHVLNGAGTNQTTQTGPIVMFVGEMPDYFADKNNYPFYGRHGALLAALLQAANVSVHDIYRTYAVRCRTPGRPARKPLVSEVKACRPYLIEEIRRVNPDVIVSLGPIAIQSLIAHPDMEQYEYALEIWEDERLNADHEYQAEVARYNTAKGEGHRVAKPKRPKLSAKPRAPKSKKVNLKDVIGHVQVQPETGIPVVPSYGLSYLLSGNFEECEVAVKHIEKAWAIANGNMPWFANQPVPQYPIIDTLDKLRALRDYLVQCDTVWFDCETTGLKWMGDDVLCWSFSGGRDEGFVFPLLHNPGNGMPELLPAWETPNGKLVPEVVQILREIFGAFNDKGGHNVLFDIRMLERSVSAFVTAGTAYGIRVNGRIKDTELLSHAIEESIPHNMTMLLSYHTNMPFYEDEIKQYKKQMAKAPNHIIWPYAGADAEALPLLWDTMRPIAEAEGTHWALDNITTNMLRVCRHIEDQGLPIDTAYFAKLCLFYQDQIEEAEQELWVATPHRAPGWKYTDAKTLRLVLFQELGLPVSGRKTKGGKGCEDCDLGVCFEHDETGKDALQDLIHAGVTHAALPAIIKLKNLTKRRGTYLDGGKGGFKKHIRPDDRIHPTYKVSRAETGRLASEEPNAQNIPNYVHIHPIGATCSDSTCTAFYAETYGINTENAFHDIIRAPKGYMIMNVDWSQLEIWVLAYMLKERLGSSTLLDVLESGQDIHIWMARQMFSHIDSQMTDAEWKAAHPDLRRRAKTANFGIGYGLTVQGFMLRERCTEDEAKDTISRYKAIVPIDDYFRLIRDDIETRQFVENWAQRKRHINYLPILKALGMSSEVEAAIREAINFPIQSGGSDLHSIASHRTLELIENGVLKSRGVTIIGSVHDSLTLLVKAPDEAYVQETAWIIKNLWSEIAWNQMRPNGQPLHWRVPCEVEVGDTWGTHQYEMNAKGDWKSHVVVTEKRETFEQSRGGRPAIVAR